jgi:cytochrome c553
VLIRLYLDDATAPLREINDAEKFLLDTTGIPDGPHKLRIETVENGRVTGQRFMSFTVRNGPGIAVAGIGPGDELHGSVPVIVNATEAGVDSRLAANSMETHRGIPFWFGGFAALVILCCAMYLATDPFRYRDFAKQADEVAALIGTVGQVPALPETQPTSGDDAAVPNPQNLVLADGAFLPIMPVNDIATDPARGGTIFAARCSGCHGAEAEGTLQEKVTLAEDGVYPRLAGQSRTYIYRQLVSFEDGWRDNTQMASMAKSLSQQDKLDVAAFVEGVSPPFPPRADVPADVLAQGKGIAERGLPDAGVARCSGCHGIDGAGAGDNFPSLAGQWPEYMEAQLRNWQTGARHNSWRGLMRPAATGLRDDALTAVSAYYANLRPSTDRASID